MPELVIPSGPGGAVLSERPHPAQEPLRRFLLWRIWKRDAERILFIGLNPSTADGIVDDPTVRRLVGFTKREGAGGFELVNLLSERATDPGRLRSGQEPAEADAHIEAALARCAKVVVCWGSPSLWPPARELAPEREAFVRVAAEQAGRTLWCFGMTKDTQPKHPLYLKATTPLVEWRP